jgi:hypothetical protein
MFTLYRVEKDFHFGAIRASLKAGSTLESDGSMVRYRGVEYTSAGLALLVTAGFLSATETRALPVLHEPAPAAKKVLAKPGHFTSVEDKGGGVHAHTQPDKQHIWEGSLYGNGSKTCTVCGVTLKNPDNIQVDRKSLKFQYVDAYNVSIESLKELPCPTFVGNLGGGVATNTHRTRKLTGRVESIDERLARLEGENQALRDRADKRQEVALDLLARLVTATERLLELGDSEVGARLLPDHSDIIDAIVIEPEKVLVPLAEEST